MKTLNKPIIVSLILGMLMTLSGVLSKVMMHPRQLDVHQAAINLETIIPREFDGWKIDLITAALVVNPDDKSLLNKIYNQTLSRTYSNKQGEHVMLSLAYGRDQSSDLHVHRPEICYATSGFDISDMTKTFVDTSIGRIPVMQLVAKQGSRNEPITYWIRVGDSVTRGWLEQKLTAIAYGLTGKVPDGLLVRVSTISNNEQESYRIQRVFLASLLQAIRSEDRYWLVGHLNP
jgi:EpsI family protein